jgi:hypothetical protein
VSFAFNERRLHDQNSKTSFYGSSRLFWIGTGLMFIDYISDSAMDALPGVALYFSSQVIFMDRTLPIRTLKRSTPIPLIIFG